MGNSEGLTEKKFSIDSTKNGFSSIDGEIQRTFQYTPEARSGYLAAARFVVEKSGFTEKANKDPRLIEELTKAIEMSFIKQETTLQAGKTYILGDVGAYIPRFGEVSKTFQYTPEARTGYYAAAKFVIEKSGLIQKSKEDPRLIPELTKAIEMSFKRQGITLQAGKTYILGDVCAYIPRYAIKNSDNKLPELNSKKDTVIIKDHEINQKLLSKNRYGKLRAKGEIKAIVVHQTGGSTAEGAIETFKKEGSVQYLIDKDGRIIQLVPDLNIAYHVGKPKKWVTNENSIGIEFVGFYDKVKGQTEVVYHDLTPEQQRAGQWLMKKLITKYNITSNNIFRHPEVSAKMKTEAQSVEIPE